MQTLRSIGAAAADVPSAATVTQCAATAPHAQLIEMAIAIWRARALYAAAYLGLADLLAEGERSAGELAAATSTHAPSLYRLLRALAACGLLREAEGGAFSLTQLGAALRSDAPGAARSTILTLAGDWQWKAWDHFLYSLRTGKTGLEAEFGQALFPFLAANTEHGARFDEAMIGMHGALGPALLAAYDFSAFARIVDVGGGTGRLLEMLLRASETQAAVLYEQPATASLARARLQASGLAQRCEVIEGDFFRSVPAGHEAYILAHVLHDWDDGQCVTILRNCRKAVAPRGRLLIVEAVLPESDAPHHGKLMDLLMLAVTGGRERTGGEFAELLAAADFMLVQVIETSTHQSLIEATPV